MKDFSHWKEYEGASEGSGRSEKQWLINPDTAQTGLFKYKRFGYNRSCIRMHCERFGKINWNSMCTFRDRSISWQRRVY